MTQAYTWTTGGPLPRALQDHYFLIAPSRFTDPAGTVNIIFDRTQKKFRDDILALMMDHQYRTARVMLIRLYQAKIADGLENFYEALSELVEKRVLWRTQEFPMVFGHPPPEGKKYGWLPFLTVGTPEKE